MPLEQFQGIQVFSILNKEKISQILNILNENIIKDPYYKIDELANLGFTKEQSLSILEAFYNFYDALKYPNRMEELISQLDIDDDIRQLIMETFEKIKEQGDKSKVIVTEKSEDLRIFGHDHLHRFEAIAEFRPLMDDNKLQKIVVTIIVDGETQNHPHNEPKRINFQTNFKQFQMIVEDLNKQLGNITMQISTLKEKLGNDIIDV